MGRFNHENNVAIPGFDELVLLSGDDTFQTYRRSRPSCTCTPPECDRRSLGRRGHLHAFVADGTDNDYFDLQPGETITGEFVPVPRDIAKRQSAADGHELTRAVDFPTTRRRPAHPRCLPTVRSGSSTSGATRPNTPTLANDVFDFIRIEDIAYDKRPGHVERRLHRRLRTCHGRRRRIRLPCRRTGASTRWCSTRTASAIR